MQHCTSTGHKHLATSGWSTYVLRICADRQQLGTAIRYVPKVLNRRHNPTTGYNRDINSDETIIRNTLLEGSLQLAPPLRETQTVEMALRDCSNQQLYEVIFTSGLC